MGKLCFATGHKNSAGLKILHILRAGAREGDANCKLKYKIDQKDGVKCKLYATDLPTSKNSNSSKPNSPIPYFIVSGNVGICHIPFISPDIKTRQNCIHYTYCIESV